MAAGDGTPHGRGVPPAPPTLSRRIEQRFVKADRVGWYCHTTQGMFHVGEFPLHAWTRKGIQRKARRLKRRLERREHAPQFSVVTNEGETHATH